jgi:hypothetical protein
MYYFQTRQMLLEQFPKNSVYAEIGVFKGDFSKDIYKIVKPKELHLIDIFEGKMVSGDQNGNNMTWTNLEDDYLRLSELYKDDSSVILHKGTSESILSSFPDNYFDVVYIDGDHSYNGVTIDLNLAYSKVKPKGIISGHDYGIKFVPVMSAVDDFLKKTNLKINYITLDGCPSFGIINDK